MHTADTSWTGTNRTGLSVALAASILLHALGLAGAPQFTLAPPPPEDLPPLVARIVPAPPPVVVPPAPVPSVRAEPKPAPSPRPKAKPKEKRVQPPREAVRLPDPRPVPQTDIAVAEPYPYEAYESSPDAVAATVRETPPPATAPVPQETQVATARPSIASQPSTEPYPFRKARLLYDLSYGEHPMRVGRVTHTWASDGTRYAAETTIEATGLFALLYGGKYVQRSWGSLGPDGLVPSEYAVQRGGPDRGESALFDWEEKEVQFTWRKERRTADLSPGVQDVISVLHQFYFMRPLPERTTLRIATSRKLGAFVFEVIGEEAIETPLGEMKAIHVRRRDEDADQVDVWIDPERSFLPVRIHFVDRRGAVFDQRIREIQAQPFEPGARAGG